MDEREQNILRDLARRVAEIASLPIMEERRGLWRKHNSLSPGRPMILIFPEGAWRELLPESSLECSDGQARRWEAALRRRIYYHEHFDDDTVIENDWLVPKIEYVTGWGLEPKRHDSPDPTGAWGFDPVLNNAEDLKKMKFPEVVMDEKAAQKRLEDQQELFGGILDVRAAGVKCISFHVMSHYVKRRGLTQTLMDFYSEPNLIHDFNAFFEEGSRNLLRQYQILGLLELNNDNTYHASGGNSYTDELPPPDCDPEHIRPRDMWGSSESQEMSEVSPEMHEEFVWQYERRLLEEFGLTGYGCCEDLSRKLPFVTSLNNMRRISISPFADVDACAPQLKGDFIFSWKPHPSHLCGRFDPAAIRKYTKHTVEVAKEHGCVLEMVLKDTHTCEGHPERFDEWSRTARSVVED